MMHLQTVGYHLYKNLRCNKLFENCRRNIIISASSSQCKINDGKDSDTSKEKEIIKEENLKKSNTSLKEYSPEEIDNILHRLKTGDHLYPYNSPAEKITQIFANSFKLEYKRAVNKLSGIKLGELEDDYFPRETDIVVVGGGIIGLSIAYALKQEFPNNIDIVVVDKNEEAPLNAANLGVGTLSQCQFEEEEELLMSKYCVEFLTSFERHTIMPSHEGFKIPFEPIGSLLLANNENSKKILQTCDTLKMHNIESNFLSANIMKQKFPWLNTENILFGISKNIYEGLFDPWLVLKGMKCKLINLGVKFVTAEVCDFGKKYEILDRVICKLPDNSYNSIQYGICVLANGTGSKNLIDVLNELEFMHLKIRYPLEERKRYEYCFHNPNGPGLDCPIIFDPEGVYFRREGLNGLYVAGVSSIENKSNEESGLYAVFENKIKPFLTNRIDGFKDLELRHGWIDSYDTNSANQLGMIGPHPLDSRLYFALGFTNQGLLYGPAIGRAIMELIFYSHYKTIDLSNFHPENLYRKLHLEASKKKQNLLGDFEKQAALGEI